MKYNWICVYLKQAGSHPSRGAWIEIAWPLTGPSMKPWSHPSRGAWIEIDLFGLSERSVTVAPLAGCVD